MVFHSRTRLDPASGDNATLRFKGLLPSMAKQLLTPQRRLSAHLSPVETFIGPSIR